MTNKLLGALTIALAAAAACGGSGASTASPAPTPAGAPAAPTAAARPALPSTVTPAMIAMGDSIYHARGCRNCHGPDGKGTNRAPDLTDATMAQVNGTYNDYVRLITDGVAAASIKNSAFTSAMPARGGTRPAALTDDQIKSVAAYVFTLRK